MPVTLQTPPSAALSTAASSSSIRRRSFSLRSTPPSSLPFNFQRSFAQIRASSSSVNTASVTELDAVSAFSEIVPDTVIFDDFQRFPPTAATVSSSLLLGICGLPDTIFRNAVDMALADSECNGLENPDARLSCFVNKALVNVGSDMAKLVPGRVSTEVDARFAYDTDGIIRKVHDLLKLYNNSNVPPQRLLFKIPSTWQGIEAARLLESEGIQTHLTFVYRNYMMDWARNHSDDTEIESAKQRGEDPGLALVTKTYNYIHKYGHKSKLMAAAVRNKQDLFSLLGVDYIIAPLKVLQSLKESVASPDEKYSFVRRLSPQSAANYLFSDEELIKWDQTSLANAMGPAAVQLLAAGLDGYADQAKRVEDLFGKIWPPPNV
ncbi:Transaldolase/Fructose-6-phosphate aldolase [Sesbania bispinosa]|nr:Transaldolase/Fructose-6-phosphate aldolase [Sesbania bispinosa]